MYELCPYFTIDGSVGLYSQEEDDVYHSTYGALAEGYEKFIVPANFDNYFKNNSEIKILDICFGIGYNTKSFLNYFLEKKIEAKNKSIETIDTDNNSIKNLQKKEHDTGVCNDKIDTNNKPSNYFNNSIKSSKKNKIFIKAIDIDKNLVNLSPFFISDKKFPHNKHLNFKHEKISKLLKKKVSKKYKLKKEINIILLNKLIENDDSFFVDDELQKILKNKAYRQYFDKYMLNLFEFYKNERSINTLFWSLKGFLHNIYYRYISARNKRALNVIRDNDITLETEVKDARKAIVEDDTVYNYIFLDAFTPSKCPCLWTIDFLKKLYEHLDKNGMILTYSIAANVRNAFLMSGFHVGKIYNEEFDKFVGTIAVKNKDLIKYELSEYDLGLMKTKAGIIYRDENLSLDNALIIENHKIEIDNSTLISGSRYKRTYKGEK